MFMESLNIFHDFHDRETIKRVIRNFISCEVCDLYLRVLIDPKDNPKDDLSDATKILIARKTLDEFISDIDVIDDAMIEVISSFIFLKYCLSKYPSDNRFYKDKS